MSDPIRPFGAPGTHLATGGKAIYGAPLGILMLEAMKLFCSGHWVSSIIMSQATIDAALWDDKGLKGIDTNKLKTSAEYVWLRNKRNSILHSMPDVTPITLHDFDTDDDMLARDAKKAVLLTIQGLASFLY